MGPKIPPGAIVVWLSDSSSPPRAVASRAAASEGSFAPPDRRLVDGYAFIQARHGTDTDVGLLGRDFYLIVNADGTRPRLHACASASPTDDLAAGEPERVRAMTDLGLGFFQTSKRVMYNHAPR